MKMKTNKNSSLDVPVEDMLVQRHRQQHFSSSQGGRQDLQSQKDEERFFQSDSDGNDKEGSTRTRRSRGSITSSSSSSSSKKRKKSKNTKDKQQQRRRAIAKVTREMNGNRQDYPSAFNEYDVGFFNTLNQHVDRYPYGDELQDDGGSERYVGSGGSVSSSSYSRRHNYDDDDEGSGSTSHSDSSSLVSDATQSFMSQTMSTTTGGMSYQSSGTADTGFVSRIGQGIMDIEDQVSYFFSIGGGTGHHDGDGDGKSDEQNKKDEDDDDDEENTTSSTESSTMDQILGARKEQMKSPNHSRIPQRREKYQDGRKETDEEPRGWHWQQQHNSHEDCETYDGGDVLLEISPLANAVVAERPLPVVENTTNHNFGTSKNNTEYEYADPDYDIDDSNDNNDTKYQNSIDNPTDTSSTKVAVAGYETSKSSEDDHVKITFMSRSRSVDPLGDFPRHDDRIKTIRMKRFNSFGWGTRGRGDVDPKITFMSFESMNDNTMPTTESKSWVRASRDNNHVGDNNGYVEAAKGDSNYYFDGDNTEVDIHGFQRVTSLQVPQVSSSNIPSTNNDDLSQSPADKQKDHNPFLRSISFPSRKKVQKIVRSQSSSASIRNSHGGDDYGPRNVTRARSWIERTGFMKFPTKSETRKDAPARTHDLTSAEAPSEAVVPTIPSDDFEVIEVVDPRNRAHDINKTRSFSVWDVPSLETSRSQMSRNGRETSEVRGLSYHIPNDCSIYSTLSMEMPKVASSSRLTKSTNDLQDSIVGGHSRADTIHPQSTLNNIKCSSPPNSAQASPDENQNIESCIVSQPPPPPPASIDMVLPPEESIEYDAQQWELIATTAARGCFSDRSVTRNIFSRLVRAEKQHPVSKRGVSLPTDITCDILSQEGCIEVLDTHQLHGSEIGKENLDASYDLCEHHTTMEFEPNRARFPWRRTKEKVMSKSNAVEELEEAKITKTATTTSFETKSRRRFLSRGRSSRAKEQDKLSSEHLSLQRLSALTNVKRSISCSPRLLTESETSSEAVRPKNKDGLVPRSKNGSADEHNDGVPTVMNPFEDEKAFAVQVHSRGNDGSLALLGCTTSNLAFSGAMTSTSTVGERTVVSMKTQESARPDPPSSTDFVTNHRVGSAVFHNFVEGAKDTMTGVQASVAGILIDSFSDQGNRPTLNNRTHLDRAPTRQTSYQMSSLPKDGRVTKFYNDDKGSHRRIRSENPRTPERTASTSVANCSPSTEQSTDSSAERDYEPPSLVDWCPKKYKDLRPKSSASKLLKQSTGEIRKATKESRRAMARKKVQNHARRGSLLFQQRQKTEQTHEQEQEQEQEQQEDVEPYYEKKGGQKYSTVRISVETW